MSETNVIVERRHKKRFPIVMGLRYQVLRGAATLHSGSGRTVNVSSAGVLFQQSDNSISLEPGLGLEVTMEMPTKRNGRPVEFKVVGSVVRSESGGFTAVGITKYELS